MRSACLMTGTTSARPPSFSLTSTARPRLTPCGSKRCGFPSTSWNAWVMTGSCFAAWTIAKPIRCVKETFFPRGASWAFSYLRRASSVSTTMSRNDVAVGTDSESVMFWTRRAAGPVMGVRPGDAGSGERGAVPVGAAEDTAPCSPLPSTSARLVGITGSSASLPLSKRLRHSSPTEAGSRRYCSYITCTNAALWVPKTNSLTSSNLIRCQPSAISDRQIMRVMSRCAFLLLGLLPCGAGAAQRLPSVRERLAARVAQAPATGVGLRSEEHTSELQSPCNLVCRLLLEKKKKSAQQSYSFFSKIVREFNHVAALVGFVQTTLKIRMRKDILCPEWIFANHSSFRCPLYNF